MLDFYYDFAHPSSEDLALLLPANTQAIHTGHGQMAEITQRMTRRLVRQHFGMSLRELTAVVKSRLGIR